MEYLIGAVLFATGLIIGRLFGEPLVIVHHETYTGGCCGGSDDDFEFDPIDPPGLDSSNDRPDDEEEMAKLEKEWAPKNKAYIYN